MSDADAAAEATAATPAPGGVGPTSGATDRTPASVANAAAASANGPDAGDSANASRRARTQFCAKCRNHGLVVTLKGHKKVCRFRNYHNCQQCLLTTLRQQVTALQAAERRAQKAQEEREAKKAAGLMTAHEIAAEESPPSPCSTSTVSVPPACVLGATLVPPSTHPYASLRPQANQLGPLPPPPGHQLAPLPTPSVPVGEDGRVLLESTQMLLDIFRFPTSSLPLAYAVLKEARSDVKEASNRILEGF